MTQIYDKHLSRDIDKVRLLIGDTGTPNAVLEDESITFFLSEEANIYLAAARAGETILASGKGIEQLELDDHLTVTYAGDKESAYRALLKSLREKGIEKLTSNQMIFRVL